MVDEYPAQHKQTTNFLGSETKNWVVILLNLDNFRRSAKAEIETVYDQVVNISIYKQNKQLNVLLNSWISPISSRRVSGGERARARKTMEKTWKAMEKLEKVITKMASRINL